MRSTALWLGAAIVRAIILLGVIWFIVAHIAHAQTLTVNPLTGLPDIYSPLNKGTTLPSTCAVGDLFFKTNATAGQNLYYCTATNTWTVQSTSSGSGTIATTTSLLKGDGAGGAIAGALTGDVTTSGVAATVVKINGVSMAGLATGIVKNTTGTGAPSIAVAADFPTLNQSTTGNAATATALAANGTNCSAGSFPLGVDASGAAESCTAANSITVVKAQTPLTTKGDVWVTDGTSMNRLGVGADGTVLTADAASTNGVKWSAAGGTGTVTSIATTSPITGGTITTTGTIACATCVTSAASLTSGQLLAGAGSQGTAVTNLIGDVTTSGGVATTLANIPTAVPMAGSLLATTITAPATPAAGKGSIYIDSISKNIAVKDDAGTVKHGVQTATCTNQAATAISDAGAVTCTTITSAYVNNSIALTGTDINTSNQVTVTHLASALPVNQGGTALTSGTSGGVLGFTASGTIASSAALASGAIVVGGGSGATPTTSSLTAGVVKMTSGVPSAATASDLPATTLATGTSVSLTAPRQYYVCTSTCTVTPPPPAAGYEFCVFNGDNVSTVITLAAIGSSARYENTARTAYGTAGTGTFVSGGAAKDFACIVGLDSTHYITTSSNGTWTAN